MTITGNVCFEWIYSYSLVHGWPIITRLNVNSGISKHIIDQGCPTFSSRGPHLLNGISLGPQPTIQTKMAYSIPSLEIPYDTAKYCVSSDAQKRKSAM